MPSSAGKINALVTARHHERARRLRQVQAIGARIAEGVARVREVAVADDHGVRFSAWLRRRPLGSTLFPYTTLFRSGRIVQADLRFEVAAVCHLPDAHDDAVAGT